LIYPLKRLKKNGTEVTGYFYNPNIYPQDEYGKRRKAIVNFSALANIEIILPEYIPSEFLSAVDLNKDKPQRCSICWSLRLRKTAQFAKHNGFYAFSTTLLVSPYQDQGALKKIGNEISEEEGVYFHYEDFRPGFRKAHEEAKAKGVYCQKYCGCIYSMKPRLTERK
jgi:predicted adenine nucleotide alpha hydrolase (AANH) superfamily ATPase